MDHQHPPITRRHAVGLLGMEQLSLRELLLLPSRLTL